MELYTKKIDEFMLIFKIIFLKSRMEKIIPKQLSIKEKWKKARVHEERGHLRIPLEKQTLPLSFDISRL